MALDLTGIGTAVMGGGSLLDAFSSLFESNPYTAGGVIRGEEAMLRSSLPATMRGMMSPEQKVAFFDMLLPYAMERFQQYSSGAGPFDALLARVGASNPLPQVSLPLPENSRTTSRGGVSVTTPIAQSSAGMGGLMGSTAPSPQDFAAMRQQLQSMSIPRLT